MANELLGAILAAGHGTRMAPFGKDIPKPILPIGNKPLIEYQIETMKRLGISEIVILIGHLGYMITKVLGDGSRFGVKLHYVEQKSMLGIAHAVGYLEPLLDRPFLLMLGDIYFVEDDLNDIVRKHREADSSCVLAAKIEHDPNALKKNFSILVDDNGRVSRVIEKPRYATNKLKGVGLYLFDPVIFDAIRRTPRTAMRNEYELTEAIQVHIDDGHKVCVSTCINDDINLTTPSDFLRCNLLVAQANGLNSLAAESAHINTGAMLDNAIIGPGATILNPITIRRSVILENAVVETDQDLDGVVVSPQSMVDVRSFFTSWPAGLML
ncbi:MAG: NTP transferase domain-containing protein [Rhodobacteraceae bacterium]|nr:NTP transferase domain-containing protein [Paracoccaceae bacterium]